VIPTEEIREKARENSIPESTIERDYAQNLILKNLSKINMVLKGGTGIRKIYIENYRFSDDLDFTLKENINTNDLKRLLKEIILDSRNESGISFYERISLSENINGFESSIYFQLLRSRGSPIKLKIDITNQNNEEIILPIIERKVIHLYSDELNEKVKVYALEEILAEKTRAFFERTRPRDLYDVWYLHYRVDLKDILPIIHGKFEYRDVEFNTSTLDNKKADFENAWNNSLKHQLRILPNFNEVFRIVANKLKRYET